MKKKIVFQLWLRWFANIQHSVISNFSYLRIVISIIFLFFILFHHFAVFNYLYEYKCVFHIHTTITVLVWVYNVDWLIVVTTTSMELKFMRLEILWKTWHAFHVSKKKTITRKNKPENTIFFSFAVYMGLKIWVEIGNTYMLYDV